MAAGARVSTGVRTRPNDRDRTSSHGGRIEGGGKAWGSRQFFEHHAAAGRAQVHGKGRQILLASLTKDIGAEQYARLSRPWSAGDPRLRAGDPRGRAGCGTVATS